MRHMQAGHGPSCVDSCNEQLAQGPTHAQITPHKPQITMTSPRQDQSDLGSLSRSFYNGTVSYAGLLALTHLFITARQSQKMLTKQAYTAELCLV
jgi:hypothetical protein